VQWSADVYSLSLTVCMLSGQVHDTSIKATRQHRMSVDHMVEAA